MGHGSYYRCMGRSFDTKTQPKNTRKRRSLRLECSPAKLNIHQRLGPSI